MGFDDAASREVENVYVRHPALLLAWSGIASGGNLLHPKHHRAVLIIEFGYKTVCFAVHMNCL